MRDTWLAGGRHHLGHSIIAAVALAARAGCASAAFGDAMVSEVPCSTGFYLHDPVALHCRGGHGQKTMVLMPKETPFQAFTWVAPAGTVNLSVAFQLEPLHGNLGSSILKATCEGRTLPLVGANGSLLNASLRSRTDGDRLFRWSGDPVSPQGGRFREWLSVRGGIDCNLQVTVENTFNTSLVGEIQFSWDGIVPCPKVLPGCRACPTDTCESDEVAVCDGSASWECVKRPHRWTTSGPLGGGSGAAIQTTLQIGTTGGGAALQHRKSAPPLTTSAVATTAALVTTKAPPGLLQHRGNVSNSSHHNASAAATANRTQVLTTAAPLSVHTTHSSRIRGTTVSLNSLSPRPPVSIYANQTTTPRTSRNSSTSAAAFSTTGGLTGGKSASPKTTQAPSEPETRDLPTLQDARDVFLVALAALLGLVCVAGCCVYGPGQQTWAEVMQIMEQFTARPQYQRQQPQQQQSAPWGHAPQFQRVATSEEAATQLLSRQRQREPSEQSLQSEQALLPTGRYDQLEQVSADAS